MRTRTILVTAVAATALLAGCSDGSGPTASGDPSSTGSAPQAGATGTPSATPGGTAPSATPSDAATEVPAASREVPAECASLALAGGATYSGEALCACVAEALPSYGSGRMRMFGDDLDGTVAFTYTPAYSFSVEGKNAGDTIRMTYNDGEVWVDQGKGPVRGDMKSEKQEEMLAGFVAEMYRSYSDPAMYADLVRSSKGWTADAGTKAVELPDGSSVDSFRIVSDKPFTWHDAPVDEYVLEFGADWVPVSAAATMSVLGQSSTVTQHFYDLGADITITPLG